MSLKESNESLKIKNSFCHKEIYQKLPPQEKDFVYQKAMRQLGNLEYKSVYRHQQQTNAGLDINGNNRSGARQSEVNLSRAEQSFRSLAEFYQARILGEKTEFGEPRSNEISERETCAVAVLLNNQSTEKTRLIGQNLRQSSSIEYKKIGEKTEAAQTLAAGAAFISPEHKQSRNIPPQQSQESAKAIWKVAATPKNELAKDAPVFSR